MLEGDKFYTTQRKISWVYLPLVTLYSVRMQKRHGDSRKTQQWGKQSRYWRIFLSLKQSKVMCNSFSKLTEYFVTHWTARKDTNMNQFF